MSKQNKETPYKLFLQNVKSYKPENLSWIPDWKKASSYDIDPSNTEPERWAWEFLRRNRNFQKECDLPDLHESGDGWGLGKFKHYQSEYIPAPTGTSRIIPPSPVWKITQPAKIIDKSYGPLRTNGVREYPLELEVNQIAVVFDLNLSLTNPGLLDTQVDNAREKLKLALARLQKEKGKATMSSKRWETKLLTYLRVADALSSENISKPKEIGKVLFEDALILVRHDPYYLSDRKFGRAVEHHIEVAYQLIYSGGYLNLLVAR